VLFGVYAVYFADTAIDLNSTKVLIWKPKLCVRMAFVLLFTYGKDFVFIPVQFDVDWFLAFRGI